MFTFPCLFLLYLKGILNIHVGILDVRFDTPIEVTEGTGASHADAKHCGSRITGKGSTMAKTLSTNETIDVEEILHEAQEIRKNCQGNEAPSVVSGKIKTLFSMQLQWMI